MISMNLSAVNMLARDLARGAEITPKQARGIAAKALDQAAAAARSRAAAEWQPYGRGMRGSAGTIRARMSRSEPTVGYLFADGEGAWFRENGGGHGPPKPVMEQSVMGALGGLAKGLSGVKIL